MREIGPFEKRNPRSDAPAAKRPKPDFVQTTLSAPELHAYYIALISSPTLAVRRFTIGPNDVTKHPRGSRHELRLTSN